MGGVNSYFGDVTGCDSSIWAICGTKGPKKDPINSISVASLSLSSKRKRSLNSLPSPQTSRSMCLFPRQLKTPLLLLLLLPNPRLRLLQSLCLAEYDWFFRSQLKLASPRPQPFPSRHNAQMPSSTSRRSPRPIPSRTMLTR